MRKRQISPISLGPSAQAWLDVEHRALVEVTSEENGYPIESALVEAENPGRLAGSPGTQTIRLIFDEPQTHDSDLYARNLQVIGILWMAAACIRTNIAWSLNQTDAHRSVDIGETAEVGRPTFRWPGSIVLWPSTWRTRRDAQESVPSC